MKFSSHSGGQDHEHYAKSTLDPATQGEWPSSPKAEYRTSQSWFQWYAEAIAARKDIKLLFVVSLDLVIGQEWGDIGRQETYDFWTHAIYSSYVLGMLRGHPCCTWFTAKARPMRR